MQFELILARQITSWSRGHGPMIFMPQMLYFLFFCSLASLDILFLTKECGLKPPKNTITYNITVHTLNDFRVELLKRRLPSDMTFVAVKYGICAGHFLYVTTCI